MRLFVVIALVANTLLPAALVPLAAHASDMGIAAVVNDHVISSHDLDERIRLVLATSGKQISREQFEQARKQILQGMVDETLRLDEAARFSIQVSPDDIAAAAAAIEQQQNKPAGSLKQFIEANGLSYDSFAQQMKSQVAWQKLIAQKTRRDVSVSDDEIRSAQQRLAKGRALPEVRMTSLLLPPQAGLSEQEMQTLAQEIRGQWLQGADATQLVLQYQSRYGLEFTPMSWVPESRLTPDLLDLFSQMTLGDITQPIATPLGLHIVKLLERRTLYSVPEKNAEVAIKQIILKLDNASEEREIESKMGIAKEIARYPGSCLESGIAGLQEFAGLNIDVNYYRTTMANMPPEIRAMIDPLPVTGITAPFASSDGIHLLMLCERIAVPAPLPEAEKVKTMLIDEKLQLESEKYMRKLRREAFIDMRL